MSDTADEQSRKLTIRAGRTVTIIQVVQAVVLAVLVVALSLVTGKLTADDARLQAACTAYFDIGSSPIPSVSSRLGVKLVIDFRDSFVNSGCAGHLPPPGAELTAKARQYGLVVRQ